MGLKTSIQWTDSTHNFWMGCLKVSPGCKQCYMYRDMERYGRDPKVVIRTKGFDKPLNWKEPQKVFVNSWSDFFIEQADEWIDDAWEIIRRTPHLTYQILTKRPENIKDRLPDDWETGWPHVWLGVSVESKKYLWRIEALDPIPAVVKFVSYEPALEYVDFSTYAPILDWLIAGGESGYNPRWADIDWFRQVRDDCLKSGIPYFLKQLGGLKKVDGAWGGRLLDGRTWDEFPKISQPQLKKTGANQ